jgi:hypothetical protein
MYESASLAVEIAKRKADLEDHEWELECMLSVREDSSQWGTTEAAEERLRQDALADAEIRDRLNVTEFSKRAHARLDFLLSVAHATIGNFHRRRGISLAEEMQRGESGSDRWGPVN